MNITITIPEISDVPTMIEWGKNNKELWAGEDTGWYLPETLKDLIKDPKQDVILIAKDGTTAVGMCLVHSLREWAYCAALFITKEYRGRGVGTLLLNEAMDRIKKQGIKYFSLLVEVNNTEAQKFYNANGFKKGYTHHWMEKKL